MDEENKKSNFSEKLLALFFAAALFLLVWKVNPSLDEKNNPPAGGLPDSNQAQAAALLNPKIEKPKIEIPVPEINAISFASYLFFKNGDRAELASRESRISRPIASVSKLMAAFVVFKTESKKSFTFENFVKITPEAILQDGDQIKLVSGENLKVFDLLKAMLISSSNDAAYSLSNYVGGTIFVDLMNEEAERLGLFNTRFSNVHGLENKGKPSNYSTAYDLATLAFEIEKKYPEIFEMTKIKEANIFSAVPAGRQADKKFMHHLKSTNDLLGEFDEFVGGKTGYTEEANGTFLTVLKTKENNLIVNIILGAQDRTSEMRKLINWSLKYYSYK